MTDAVYALVGFDLRGHGISDVHACHFPLSMHHADYRHSLNFWCAFPIFHTFYMAQFGRIVVTGVCASIPYRVKWSLVTGAALRSSLQEQKNKIAMVNLLGSLLPNITVPSGLDATTISRDTDVIKKYTNDPLVHDKTSLGLGKTAITAIELCLAHAREFKPPLLIMHAQMIIDLPQRQRRFRETGD